MQRAIWQPVRTVRSDLTSLLKVSSTACCTVSASISLSCSLVNEQTMSADAPGFPFPMGLSILALAISASGEKTSGTSGL